MNLSALTINYSTNNENAKRAKKVFIMPGTKNIVVGSFRIESISLKKTKNIMIQNTGNMKRNRDISGIKLWYDKNGNGRWDAEDIKTHITANWNSSKSAWTFSGSKIIPNTDMLLTIDITSTAGEMKTFICSASLEDTKRKDNLNNLNDLIVIHDLRNVVVSTDEISLIKTTEATDRIAAINAADIPILFFKVLNKSGAYISELKIGNIGTMNQNEDISEMYLKYDVNLNNRCDNDDIRIGNSATWNSITSTWDFKDLIALVNTNIMVTINIAPSGINNRTFCGIIEPGYIKCANGIENAASLTNFGELTLYNPVILPYNIFLNHSATMGTDHPQALKESFAINLSGFSNIVVSYDYYKNFEASNMDRDITLEYLADDNSWKIIEKLLWNENDIGELSLNNFLLPNEGYHSNFKLRLRTPEYANVEKISGLLDSIMLKYTYKIKPIRIESDKYNTSGISPEKCKLMFMGEFGFGNFISLYGLLNLKYIYAGCGFGYSFYNDEENGTTAHVFEPSIISMIEYDFMQFRIRTGLSFVSESEYGFSGKALTISPDIFIKWKNCYTGMSFPIVIGSRGTSVVFAVGIGYNFRIKSKKEEDKHEK